MDSLDNEVKFRLIDICSERLDKVEQKLDEKRFGIMNEDLK